MKTSRLLNILLFALGLPVAAEAADISLPRGTYLPNTHLMTPAQAKESAELGDAQAQHTLAHYYETGTGGIPQNLRLSAEWCRKSALQGYPDAQFDMGRKYANGQGVTASSATAAEWFRRAAMKKQPEARHVAGTLHETGKDIAMDKARASD